MHDGKVSAKCIWVDALCLADCLYRSHVLMLSVLQMLSAGLMYFMKERIKKLVVAFMFFLAGKKR